jgi:hypothetical protein
MISMETIRILKIEKGKIYYSPNVCLHIEDSSFPYRENRFSSRTIYWKVEIVEYNNKEEIIKVKVLDYSTTEIDLFNSQTIKRQLVRIEFEKFEKDKLLSCLISYKPASLSDFIIEDSNSSKKNGKNNDSINFENSKLVDRKSEFTEVSIPINTIEKEEILYPIKKLKFHNGYVEAGISSKHSKIINKKTSALIYNDSLKEEFQAISHYIEKGLNIKNINIELEIENKRNIIKATSFQIEKINEELIENAKFSNFYNTITSENPSIKSDDNIVPVDSIIEKMSLTKASEAMTASELVSRLLSERNPVHFHHLSYLSKYHLTEHTKLRFVLKPHFAYLFLLKIDNSYNFILETHKAELATYIWEYTCPTDMEISSYIQECYNHVSQEISKIKSLGRNKYKAQKLDNFRDIEHDYISNNGFLIWKDTLNNPFTF